MACAGCPKQRYIPGEPDKLQERDRVGIVEGSCGYRGQYSGKIRFIEKRGVQDEGSRQVAKRNCDPRQAYPEVKPQGRNLVRVVGIVAHFAPLGPVARENSFYRANRGGGDGPRRRVLGAKRGGTLRESQANFSRESVGFVEGSCGYLACGVNVREKFVLSRNIRYKTSGVAMLLKIVLTTGNHTQKSNFRDGT